MTAIVCGTNRPLSISSKIAAIYKGILSNLKEQSEIIELADLPGDFVFSALYENNGKNATFNAVLEVVKKSEKIVFVVPEYNGSFPGVLKAFIDGFPYPNTLLNKKCALVGLSSGTQGGGLALSHLTDILNYCGAYVLPIKPRLALIESNLSQDFALSNPQYQNLLEAQAKQLVTM